MSVRLLAFLGFGLLAIAAGVLFWLQASNPNSPQSEAISFPTYDTHADLSEAFIEALENQDEDQLLSLITGYEGVAEQLRDAALNDTNFLARFDLTARQKLAILALRDRFTARDIKSMSAQDLIQVHPDPSGSTLGLPAGAKALFHGLTLTDGRSGTLELYIGPEFHAFPVRQDRSGWKVDLTEVFNPPSLTPIDVELMSRIAARGSTPTAWLSIYSSLSGRSVDEGLLQLP